MTTFILSICLDSDTAVKMKLLSLRTQISLWTYSDEAKDQELSGPERVVKYIHFGFVFKAVIHVYIMAPLAQY